MPNYAISYFDEPSFDSPDAGEKYKEKWLAWANNLGDALVNPATPLGIPKVVSLDGVTNGERAGRLTGYSIVQADSMAAAIEMAKLCPHLAHGTLEVAEVFEM